MIQDYFEGYEIPRGRYNKEQLGCHFFKNKLEESTQVVLFSYTHEKEDYSGFREELYQLYYGNWDLKIVDLGHFIKPKTPDEEDFILKEVFNYCYKFKIKMVVVSEDYQLVYKAYRGLDEFKDSVNVAMVDPKISLLSVADLEDLNQNNLLNHLMINEPRNLDNYYHLSYLSFYLSQAKKDLLEGLNFQIKRLGDINYDLTEVEPELRMSEIIGFGLSSIKNSDCPRTNKVEVNGLSSDQAVRIVRYAGLSEVNEFFNIYDFDPKNSSSILTSQTVAQLLWYYMEGLNQRKIEKPSLDSQQFKKYIVPMDIEQTLVFYQSQLTNKWWVEIGLLEEAKNKKIYACSYQDYLNAVNNKLPERYWKYFKKYF